MCHVCATDENPHQLLLCDGDGCDRGYHIYCLQPPLAKVPEEVFFTTSILILSAFFIDTGLCFSRVCQQDEKWICPTCLASSKPSYSRGRKAGHRFHCSACNGVGHYAKSPKCPLSGRSPAAAQATPMTAMSDSDPYLQVGETHDSSSVHPACTSARLSSCKLARIVEDSAAELPSISTTQIKAATFPGRKLMTSAIPTKELHMKIVWQFVLDDPAMRSIYFEDPSIKFSNYCINEPQYVLKIKVLFRSSF